MPLFESYDRRIKQINEALAKYGIGSIEEAEQLCLSKGINPREIVNGIQPIAFENAGWAYVVGAAIAIKKGDEQLDEAVQKVDGPFSLVFGNEASGLPDAFAQMGVSTLIPHSHQIDSLNLAIAAGIGMYAFTRR